GAQTENDELTTGREPGCEDAGGCKADPHPDPNTDCHRALRKVYRGGVEAVKGIDFEVAPGEVFGLLDPNGAGKSTTIGMLTTTVVPTSGCARLAGYDVVKDPRRARSVSSVVFQEAVVDSGLTGRANLDLHAHLCGVPPATAAT